MANFPKTRAEAIAIGSLKYHDGMPCNRGHVSVRYTDTKACVDCQTLRETVLVKVVVDVSCIDIVDGFNESLLHRRLESSFRGRDRASPMPKLRSKCRIALRVHPDDVAELTAYADSLPKPKTIK